MEIDSDRRSYCHSEIVAQSVEANAFVAAAGRQDINGAGTVGNGYGAKRSAMQGSADGKHQDGAGRMYPAKKMAKAARQIINTFFRENPSTT